jgi:hypothetical protein
MYLVLVLEGTRVEPNVNLTAESLNLVRVNGKEWL